MRVLFVGGPVDNSELDVEPHSPSIHYPRDSGHGHSRYRLHEVGWRGGDRVYAVYAAPDLAGEDVDRVVSERDYARRFNADTRDAHA
jgi:hypothetical protein